MLAEIAGYARDDRAADAAVLIGSAHRAAGAKVARSSAPLVVEPAHERGLNQASRLARAIARRAVVSDAPAHELAERVPIRIDQSWKLKSLFHQRISHHARVHVPPLILAKPRWPA
jgi:hypothetical protein